MAEPKTIQDLLYEQFAQGKRPSHPDVKAIKVNHAKINRNTRYRYFSAFKKSIGTEEYTKLFPENEPTAENPSASAPPVKLGEETLGEVTGKPETREEKAQAEGNKAEHERNQAEHEGNKADSKTKKAETKTPPSFRATTIPGEAAWIRVIPREFVMTSTIFWAAMEAAINYWGWPADIPPAEFADRYFRITMEQRDVNLGPSRIMRPGTDDGNGEHEAQEPEIDWEIEAQSYDRIDQEALVRAASASEE